MRLAAFTLIAALAAASAFAQAGPGQPAVERREIGNQVLENIPDASPELREAMRRYQNTRGAGFRDWLADGSMLISTRFGATAQLHRVAAPGAARTQITFFDEPVGAAEAVPNSEFVLFGKDRGGDEWVQLHLMDADGRDRAFTEPGTRNFSAAFTPDGETVVWARQKRGSGETEILVAPVDGSAAPRVVFSANGSWSPLDVSPDGRTVLVGRYVSIADSDRHLLDLETGRMRELVPAKDVVAYGGGEFTPDGRAVILLSDRGSDVTRLVRLDTATGRETPISAPDLKWPVESFDLSDDGRLVAYSVNEEGWSKVVVQDVLTRRALPQPTLPKGVVVGLKFDSSASRLAITLATATAASDVWSVDVASGAPTRWTESELGGLRAADLSEPELIRVTSFDGLSVPAFLYKPARPRPGKLPVIVSIHGGPESQARPTFNPQFQFYANELGAAVLVPNVRGSDGYGKRYLALDNAEKREDSVKDIGAFLDWIGTRPDLDAARVAVTGGSYGGYMSLAAMTHYSDRLVGGVNLFGISNFKSFLQNTEAYRRDLRRAEYGDERDPKMAAVFDRISPLNNVARITKPMLIQQGANDPRVPQSESDQIVRELRARDVPTWYLLFKDEGHGWRKKPNQDRAFETQVLFFKKVFGLEAN
jgi:dipeptidyl aminopeptidase/acylaminoacyl peptidase